MGLLWMIHYQQRNNIVTKQWYQFCIQHPTFLIKNIHNATDHTDGNHIIIMIIILGWLQLIIWFFVSFFVNSNWQSSHCSSILPIPLASLFLMASHTVTLLLFFLQCKQLINPLCVSISQMYYHISIIVYFKLIHTWLCQFFCSF